MSPLVVLRAEVRFAALATAAGGGGGGKRSRRAGQVEVELGRVGWIKGSKRSKLPSYRSDLALPCQTLLALLLYISGSHNTRRSFSQTESTTATPNYRHRKTSIASASTVGGRHDSNKTAAAVEAEAAAAAAAAAAAENENRNANPHCVLHAHKR